MAGKRIGLVYHRDIFAEGLERAKRGKQSALIPLSAVASTTLWSFVAIFVVTRRLYYFRFRGTLMHVAWGEGPPLRISPACDNLIGRTAPLSC